MTNWRRRPSKWKWVVRRSGMIFRKMARSCFSRGRSPGVTSVWTGTSERILRKVLFRFTGSMQMTGGPAISVEHGRFDRFQKPPVVLRPAIEELGLLRALGWNLAFGLLPRDVALHAHPFQAARTRPPSSGRLFTEQALCPPLGTNEPPHELFTATRPAGCRKPERTWGTTFLLWEP